MGKRIAVVGANGQVGLCMQELAKNYPELEVDFFDKTTIDICQKEQIHCNLNKKEYTHLINLAAYTKVDLAETESDLAYAVNLDAVKNLVDYAKEKTMVFIHLSTDYVFDGERKTAYTETDIPNPINVYGSSKLAGEKYIQEQLEAYYIIRSSWLYSNYGHNFYKSIKRAILENKTLKITTEQVGTPTLVDDLVDLIFKLVSSENQAYGLYHFSNTGQGSWYDFALSIEKKSLGSPTGLIQPISVYPTVARRPKFSVLDTSKIKQTFGIEIRAWQETLKEL